MVAKRVNSQRKSTPKVMALLAEGRSYSWIARDLGISKNTVTDIVVRNRPTEGKLHVDHH